MIQLTLWTQSLHSPSSRHLSNAFGVRTSRKCLAWRILCSRLLSNLPASSLSTSMNTVKLLTCRWTLSKLKQQNTFTTSLNPIKHSSHSQFTAYSFHSWSFASQIKLHLFRFNLFINQIKNNFTQKIPCSWKCISRPRINYITHQPQWAIV